MSYDHVWSFRTARFRVALECDYETDPDLSFDDSGEIAAKIENGDLANYTFRVAVYCDGVLIAADYLGNSIYADPLDFYREHIGNRSTYFSDMTRAAIDAARQHFKMLPKLRA